MNKKISLKPEPSKKPQNAGSSFFKPVVQAKLTINQPNDIYEQEADAAADKVMRMTDRAQTNFFNPVIPYISRKCDHCEEEEKMQRREMNGEETTADDSLENYVGSLSGGKPLPNEVRNFYEPRLGYDFSHVKVHTDTVAAKSAQSINALAYTSGNNIVFNKGQYSPGTDSGKKLLAHELTHTVQQGNQIAAKIQRQPKPSPKAAPKPCPAVVATSTYSRGNDDWAECDYETARMKVDLMVDRCACSSSVTDMPVSVNYVATLGGKSFTGRTIPNPSGTGTIKEEEGQASHIATGVVTSGRSSTGRTQRGMSLSEDNLPAGASNVSGPLVLKTDDSKRKGKPGDPGDTVSQNLSVGTVACAAGSTKTGQVSLGGGFQVINYDLTILKRGVKASITLTEPVTMTGRISTPIIDIKSAAAYPAFPGKPRPGGKGCTCDATTGVQTGTGCKRATGGSGFGKPGPKDQ